MCASLQNMIRKHGTGLLIRKEAVFFNIIDWKYVYEYGNKNRFIPLLIRDDDAHIAGIFPLVEQKSNRIFPSLSSLPEGATGGFLLSRTLGDTEKERVTDAFFTYIDENYSRSHAQVYLKEQIPVGGGPGAPSSVLLGNGFQWLDNTITRLPCTHYLKLEQPFEEKIWNGLWSKRLRKRIRHVQKTGLQVIVDEDLTYADAYGEMYYESVKKFGITAEKDEISQLFRIFRNKMLLFIGLLDSRPVSAALCFYTPTTAYLSKAPYLPAAGDYLTNTLPICTSIQYACERSYKYYEMGITTTPDLAFHKEKFEATRYPLRVYTRKFSSFRAFANKTYGYLLWGRKKITGP